MGVFAGEGKDTQDELFLALKYLPLEQKGEGGRRARMMKAHNHAPKPPKQETKGYGPGVD